MMKRNPKMAAMMQGHSNSNNKSIYSYHGPLTMFDNQVCFNEVFKDPVEFYKLSSGFVSGGAVFERDSDNERFEKICEKIRFETFVEEFRQHYVGEDTPELRSFILSSTTKAITSIRASFIHAGTKARITISPDDMFRQMAEYVVLLPEAANTWMFSLAETYYRALTPVMQADMIQNEFKMPGNHQSSF